MDKAKEISKDYADQHTCYANDPKLQYLYTRKAVEFGYHQAEKDLELSWEDIREIACLIDTVRAEVDDDYLLTLSIPKRIENEHREYKEVLKRFKEFKERNEK